MSYLPHELGGTKDLPFLKCNANSKSLEPLAPLLGKIDMEDRHMRSSTFLYGIQFRTSFIRSFFS